MAKTLFEVLYDKYDEEIAMVSSWVADGKAESQEHYREMCGTIRGLRTARDIVKNLDQQHREDDDE